MTNKEALEAVRRSIVTSRALHRQGFGNAVDISYRFDETINVPKITLDGQSIWCHQPYRDELLDLIDAYNHLKKTLS
jgi:hypothetical protein